MSNLNKFMGIGRLGRDPDIRMAGTKKVANFSVAITEKYKDKEKTEWINVVAWDKLADVIERYLKKGSLVYFEGKLETQKWEDKEGQNKSRVEVIISSLQMLGNKTSEQSDSQQVEEDDLPF